MRLVMYVICGDIWGVFRIVIKIFVEEFRIVVLDIYNFVIICIGCLNDCLNVSVYIGSVVIIVKYVDLYFCFLFVIEINLVSCSFYF